MTKRKAEHLKSEGLSVEDSQLRLELHGQPEGLPKTRAQLQPTVNRNGEGDVADQELPVAGEVDDPVRKPGVVANQGTTKESEVDSPTNNDGDVATSVHEITSEVAGGRGVEPHPFWDLLKLAGYEEW